MRQANVFIESEGDKQFSRNRDRLGVRTPDPVAEMVETLFLKPQRVLEIGCANGWRLAALRDKYGCEVYGVDPSRNACMEAAGRRIPAFQSTACVLPVSSQFDLIIYGFMLYLAGPEDWLTIAAEGDRSLKPGGHIIIHDFAALEEPFARPYEHRDGLLSYHVDFPKLWLAHPLYRCVNRRVLADSDEAVTALKKSLPAAIPVLP